MATVRRADFADPQLVGFLSAHLAELAPTSPPESRHALDIDALRAPGVRLWTAYDGESLVGTVALAPVDTGHEELKSMRTDPARRGRGIGALLLDHALSDARSREVTRVSLETGSADYFAPARALYRRRGFAECEPFASYTVDVHSTFMTLDLRGTA
ncbi:GNAT family N-acetyltransferase [Flexivirga sp. ID2601S]|uniref:GNAT family N-acetyltransferase n=1 Tax=Flexivirga aerilata TaxID=1656889 RepID=A0A849AJV3_9MICO|nr:GNAT family N-acetyltransferase [Flexivirga aerilata]NNG41114.1 GNAT family N-acetyltransferase [Flexivirga aerilata]